MKNVRSAPSRSLTTSGKGKHFEVLALKFLRKQGLRQFQLNFYCRFGEIDLIAQDAGVLVFIEVRYRKNRDHGDAAATVNFYKQQKIIRTAEHYLQKNGLTNKMPCRFDVIGISGSVDALEIQWIKNAF